MIFTCIEMLIVWWLNEDLEVLDRVLALSVQCFLVNVIILFSICIAQMKKIEIFVKDVY